jgi:hypothetical protein
VLFPIAAFASVSFDAYGVMLLFAAAVRDSPGTLFASPFDRDVRANADRGFHPDAHAAVRSVFQSRRRHAGCSVFVRPQDIDPGHQGNSKLRPFFTHGFTIGKKLKGTNPKFLQNDMAVTAEVAQPLLAVWVLRLMLDQRLNPRGPQNHTAKSGCAT